MGVLHGVNAYRSPAKTGCTRSGVHHITARVSDAVDAVLNRLMRFDVAKLQLAAVTRAIMRTVGADGRRHPPGRRRQSTRRGVRSRPCRPSGCLRGGRRGGSARAAARAARWMVGASDRHGRLRSSACLCTLLCFLPGRPLAGAPGYRRTPWAGVALAVTLAKGTTLLIRARCAQTLARRSSH